MRSGSEAPAPDAGAALARVAGGLVAHDFGAPHVYGWTPPRGRA